MRTSIRTLLLAAAAALLFAGCTAAKVVNDQPSVRDDVASVRSGEEEQPAEVIVQGDGDAAAPPTAVLVRKSSMCAYLSREDIANACGVPVSEIRKRLAGSSETDVTCGLDIASDNSIDFGVGGVLLTDSTESFVESANSFYRVLYGSSYSSVEIKTGPPGRAYVYAREKPPSGYEDKEDAYSVVFLLGNESYEIRLNRKTCPNAAGNIKSLAATFAENLSVEQ